MDDWEPVRARSRRMPLLVGAVVVAAGVAGWLLATAPRDDGALEVDRSPASVNGLDLDAEPEPLPRTVPRTLAGGGWELLAPSPLSPRFNVVHAWTGEELVIVGGDEGVDATRDAAAYDPADDTWRELADAPEPVRQPDHAAAWTGRELVVWGGVDQATGFAYHPESDRWRRLADAPLSGRRHHVAVFTGEEVVVWGGRDDDGPRTDGAAYDPEADRWRDVADAPNVAGMGVATWADPDGCPDERCGVLLVWGPDPAGIDGGGDADDESVDASGEDGRGGDAPSDGDWAGAAYDPERDRWESLAPLPRRAGSGIPSLTWGDGTALLCCEFDGGAHLAAYDPARDEWTSRGAAPVGRRTLHAHAWTGDELVVWGGRIRDRWIRGSGGTYDPTADQWASLPFAPAGRARIQPASAWTGAHLLVWGGYDGREPLADGLRWHPDR